MNAEEIAEVLRLHGLFLKGWDGGKQAYFQGADLQWADLGGANLTNANLRGADLRGTNLTNANLNEADLQWANLRGANLTNANLTNANLRGANLTHANLTNANLTRTDLSLANLAGATLPPTKTVLPEGSFTAYKKVAGDVILTLEIPAEARRTGSLVGRKCRADRVRVVSASAEGTTFTSLWDSTFVYTVGSEKTEPTYDGDIRVECAPGIHFFLTIEEATEFELT